MFRQIYYINILVQNKLISNLISNMGGYDLLNNNCDHFSNLCAFGKKKSDQVDDILNLLGGLFR